MSLHEKKTVNFKEFEHIFERKLKQEFQLLWLGFENILSVRERKRGRERQTEWRVDAQNPIKHGLGSSILTALKTLALRVWKRSTQARYLYQFLV
jgi:hypothetical protein